MARSRNYCFTDFELLDHNKTYETYKDIIRYIGWGKEICPETKRLHYQGWIQFYNPKRMSRCKNILGSKKIHVNICKGSEYDNDTYCKKDGEFSEHGKFMTQGYRSDLEAIKKEIKNGASRENIMDSHFEIYCRYRNGINDYINICEKKKRAEFRKVDVEYIYGPTGTGKTRYAYKPSVYKITGDNLQWFDGYEGEKELLIDEYDNNVPITKMLNLLDGYKLRLPIKGGFTYANWTKVFITSNLSPNQLHEHAKPKSREALMRRITKVIHIAQPPKPNNLARSVAG